MLNLTLTDIGVRPDSNRAGVIVWWPVPPGRKQRILAIQWPDLLLFRPDVQWPEEVRPKRIPGWGRESVHLTWVADLHSLKVRLLVPVPALSELLTLRPGDGERAYWDSAVHQIRRSVWVTGVNTGGDPHCWINRTSPIRIRQAISHDVTLRIHQIPRTGGAVLAAWRDGKLRAAASLLTELP